MVQPSIDRHPWSADPTRTSTNQPIDPPIDWTETDRPRGLTDRPTDRSDRADRPTGLRLTHRSPLASDLRPIDFRPTDRTERTDQNSRPTEPTDRPPTNRPIGFHPTDRPTDRLPADRTDRSTSGRPSERRPARSHPPRAERRSGGLSGYTAGLVSTLC